MCNLQNTHLQHIPKISTLGNLKIISPFFQQNNTKKLLKTFPLQLLNILGDLYCFEDFAWKLSSLQFSNKSMLQSVQQTKKFDLNYYVINHQRFKKAYIFLPNLQNTNLQVMPTKTPLANLIADYLQKRWNK